MPAYDTARIQASLTAIDGAPTSDAKGDALEALARYLFETIPGVAFMRKNILDAPRAHELDVAFWNDSRVSQLYFIDAVIIVECKAAGTPTGSHDVGWYVRKLQDRGSGYGILIALNGITGDGNTSAHSEVLAALTRDGIRILVLTRAEIVRLASTEDLSDLLKEKVSQLTLDRVVHITQT
jgi:hypothetical protein